jgi:hypothetical protein
MLYMFQAVSPPIIRSSKLYTQHLVYTPSLLAATASVGELPMLAVAASKVHTYQIPCVHF